VVKLVIKPKIVSPVARHGKQFIPKSLRVGSKVIPTNYEDDTITQYWVMAHFSCIPYDVPVWPWPFTYFSKNWVTWPGGRVEYMCLFGSLQTFSFL